MDKDLYHKAVYIWRGGLRCCQVQKGTFWKMKLQSIPSHHQKLFLWRLQKNRKLLLWQKLRLMWLVRATYLLQSMFQHSSSWSLNSAMLIPCTSTLCHGKLLTPCAENKICSQYVLWMWCEGTRGSSKKTLLNWWYSQVPATFHFRDGSLQQVCRPWYSYQCIEWFLHISAVLQCCTQPVSKGQAAANLLNMYH